MNKILVYQDSKGEISTFEVEAKYIKGNKFSAKNIETGRQRSFSMNLTLGLFDTRKEADSLLKDIESIKLAGKKSEAQLDRLKTKSDKLRTKSEKFENQSERLSERADKKYESMERAQDKDEFERAQELEKESDKLSEKATTLENEAYELSEEADKIELEECEKLEEIDNLGSDFFEQLKSHAKAEILALEIEVRAEAPKPKPTVEPPALNKPNSKKGLKIAASIILLIIILVVIL